MTPGPVADPEPVANREPTTTPVRTTLLYFRNRARRVSNGTVSVPDEQYERLAALATARGVTPETQLARLIDDAYAGLDGESDSPEGLPLGVSDCSDGE